MERPPAPGRPLTARPAGADRSTLLVQVRAAAKRQRVLLERLSRAEELADSLAQDLSAIEGSLLAADRAAPDARMAHRGDDRLSAARRSLQRTAEAGAATLAVSRRTDDSLEVRVDGGKAFRLPPVLGDLLEILAFDGEPAADGLAGWQSLDEVALRLGKRSGHDVRRHTATQHVYRLRRELFARGGVNPFLVQTSRRLGVRFALRRQPRPWDGAL